LKAREYYLTRIVFNVVLLGGLVIGIATQADWNDPSTPIYCLIILGTLGILVAWDSWDYFHTRPDQPYGFSDTQVRAWAARNSRTPPGILLVVSLLLTTFILIEGNPGGARWLTVHLAAPLLLLIGLAGTLHPPLYYALSSAVRTDGRTRALAYAIAGVGLLIGVYWAWIARGR